MGLTRPPIRESANFKDVIGYNVPFVLNGIRTVAARSAEYGDGKMVVLDVRGHSEELTVWGAYLIAQAEAADDADFGQWYMMVESHSVPEFTKRRVKAILPCDPPASTPTAGLKTAGDDDIPF
jgi:hypothetical protein